MTDHKQTSQSNIFSDQSEMPKMSSLIHRMMWPSSSSADDPTTGDNDSHSRIHFALPLGTSCRQNLSHFAASRCESSASAAAKARASVQARRGAIGPAAEEAEACSVVQTKFKFISNLQQYAGGKNCTRYVLIHTCNTKTPILANSLNQNTNQIIKFTFFISYQSTFQKPLFEQPGCTRI